MARKRTKFKLPPLFSNIPLVLGVSMLLIFAGWRYHQVRILSFNTREVEKFNFSGIKPTYVKSYPVGVDIKVGDATIRDGIWAILPNEVSYLNGSSGIGDKGNIIMYGHNKDNILGPIRWIKVGAKIEIKGSDGKDYIYEVAKTDTVDPDNLYYLQPTSEETLTLFTCVGFLDSKRFIVVSKRII